MTLKKKLTEVGEVTPVLTDSTVINQGGAVKQSKLSLIYTLFKTSFDSVYVSGATLAATLLNYVTNSALATALAAYTNTTNLSILLAGKENIYVDNTQTGITSVIINAQSGTAFFTGFINTGLTATLTITNSFAGANKRVLWSIYYDVAGGGLGQPQAVVYTTTVGTIVFYVKNVGVANTNMPIRITFQILN